MSPPEPIKPSIKSPDAESEVGLASQISRVRETPPVLSSSEGKLLNGVSNTASPTRPVSGGVGRRTSILFRKAKNGAKLHRDNQLQNGEGRTPQHPTPPTTTTTPLTTEATVPPVLTPVNQTPLSCSTSPEKQQEKTPPRSIETGITASFPND